MGLRRWDRLRALLAHAGLLPFIFFALFPFYFMLVTSFKSNAELYNLKSIPFMVQTGVITDHYRYLFLKTDFLIWMKNSLIISVAATAISLVIFYLLVPARPRTAAQGGKA